MDWILKLEKKIGKYAIPDIMRYVIMLQVGGFVLQMLNPTFYYSYLCMDASAIFSGQIWRMVTFLMVPPSTSYIFVFIALYCYYMIGQTIERVWGAFRFNIYLLTGILFHVLASLLAYMITGISFPMGTEYLYLSLFFAFTLLFPDMEFRWYFIIPIKAKYLAVINGLFFAYTVLQGILPQENYIYEIIYRSNAIAAAVSICNFVLFYFTTRSFHRVSRSTAKRQAQFKKELMKSMQTPSKTPNGAKHKCTVCGKTELDDETLEFRYCSKCSGGREYCQNHLFTHEHIN